jgi:hypothetical protein
MCHIKTTENLGEEEFSTTAAVGEEEVCTTHPRGEEEPTYTTMAVGEETPDPLSYSASTPFGAF